MNTTDYTEEQAADTGIGTGDIKRADLGVHFGRESD